MPQTREEKLEYQRRWYQEHPNKQREYEARRDKAKRAKWQKAYRTKHQAHFKELARLARFRRYWQARKAVIDALGGKCAECGFSDFRALECHHKYGEGNKERRNRMGTLVNDYRYYRQMLTHLQDYELLCSNCHAILNWDSRHTDIKDIK